MFHIVREFDSEIAKCYAIATDIVISDIHYIPTRTSLFHAMKLEGV